MKHALIIWGCTSGAGKSLLTTAMCRWAANHGIKVAPFKAQNMSNNARVVPGVDGAPAEIGSAQYFQALAARAAPHVDMNPVLLKPESDTASQVIVQGQVDRNASRLPWRERSGLLAEAARASFERLAARFDLIVVEGAGSPAEINLAAQDYVNLSTARWAQALLPSPGNVNALLISDIDRGGAFAHCHGTYTLLPDDLKPLLRGFVFNKFRGDASLLAPGPEQLQQATGVPLFAVLPMWREHGLPEEDGVFDEHAIVSRGNAATRIAILAAPHISNLDEFEPLRSLATVELVWIHSAADLPSLQRADWLVLPGSKQVSGDLAWLRAQGLDAAIQQHAAQGKPVLGICGGLQLLGAVLDDPAGYDGAAHRDTSALNLLPLKTTYQSVKRLQATEARFNTLQGPWSALSHLRFSGYEIRCGHTEVLSSQPPLLAAVTNAQGETIGWQQGSVLGIYAHGLFESQAVLNALFAAHKQTIDQRLDELAYWLERHAGHASLGELLGI